MASKRQLKNKLQAVGNIRQMTKAMELVAATKMRKSEEKALGARPYALHALNLLKHIAAFADREDLFSPFFAHQKSNKVCLVVLTSDKGLAGAFNSQVLKRAAKFIEGIQLAVDVVAAGRKAHDFFKRKKMGLAAEFLNFSDIVNLSDAKPLADFLISQYCKGTYQTIFVCSTQFVSALQTRVEVYQMLPLQVPALQSVIENIVPEKGKYSEFRAQTLAEPANVAYILEPSPQKLFEVLIENLVRVEILDFLFESNASEHSSRMVAMKNATDNAENLLETLGLQLNKLRQSSITQELTEIATAKEALTSE